MSEGNVSYLCEGFYPLEATNLAHAASLFALWKARRTYGPKGRCSRLDIQTELGPKGATFKAVIEAPSGGETCLLTVLIETTNISYQDSDGRWHDEVAAGDDRPETSVKD